MTTSKLTSLTPYVASTKNAENVEINSWKLRLGIKWKEL